MTFRNTLKTIALVPVLSVLIGTSALAADTDLALEPAINGEVSANGLYAFDRSADSIQLEAAINGEVSATGAFASQAEEDAYAIERGNQGVTTL